MRGSISYEDSYFLSSQEKELIGELIAKNMEITSKAGIAFI